jgi:hypothetical protein
MCASVPWYAATRLISADGAAIEDRPRWFYLGPLRVPTRAHQAFVAQTGDTSGANLLPT